MSNASKSYIDRLNRLVQECNASLVQPVKRDTMGNLKPLITQITELMNSLPPGQRARPWAIVDLQGRLQGRYKDRPSLGNIGLALRALGWVRVRDWTNSGVGRRFWSPVAESGASHNSTRRSRA